MADISNAVGAERISRVVGYAIKKGAQNVSGVNLPIRVAILAPANHANQATVGTDPIEFTSTNEVAVLAGFGSPAHQIARILRPIFGGGIGGIPTVLYPQLEGVGSTATTTDITVSGTPNKNIAHRLIINGRDNVDGDFYEFVIASTDNAAAIHAKIIDCVNNVRNSPITASLGAGKVAITSKWYGLTSAELSVAIATQGDSAGLTYSVGAKVAGAGTESISDSLLRFGNEWNTIVINSYGEAKFATLETFNGTPSASNPTGRYTGIVFKPFIACWGSTLSDKDDIVAITGIEARKNQVTNVLCPAPNSKGFSWEAAANGALLTARTMQDTPHLGIGGQSYPDMPVPIDGLIGDMADYESRDFLSKKGASTVDLVNGVYQVQDFITTYRPDGEMVLLFRPVRLMGIHWNVRFAYFLQEQMHVKDKAIAKDDDFINVSDVIKPREWKAQLFEMFKDLAARAIISDAAFSKNSTTVQVPSSNPDRFNTFFRYQVTGIVNVASTTAEANFSTY